MKQILFLFFPVAFKGKKLGKRRFWDGAFANDLCLARLAEDFLLLVGEHVDAAPLIARFFLF